MPPRTPAASFFPRLRSRPRLWVQMAHNRSSRAPRRRTSPGVGATPTGPLSHLHQHAARVTPSWHGDSVGRYEGDTLMVDTIGIKSDRPFPMVDMYGTPHTEALHVVERYRLIDYEVAKEALERNAKENVYIPPGGWP